MDCYTVKVKMSDAQLLNGWPELPLRNQCRSGLAAADGILQKKQSCRGMARCSKYGSLEPSEGVDGRRRAAKLAAGCKLVARTWFGQIGCGVWMTIWKRCAGCGAVFERNWPITALCLASWPIKP